LSHTNGASAIASPPELFLRGQSIPFTGRWLWPERLM
jgi:hypothetical protein